MAITTGVLTSGDQSIPYRYDGATYTLTITDQSSSLDDVEFPYMENDDGTLSGVKHLRFDTPNLTYIGENVFATCPELISVELPSGLLGLGNAAFYGCTKLTGVTIPDTVTSLSYNVFKGCTSLTSVTIGNSVTSIGDSAFEGCTSLTDLTLGNSVTTIGTQAFYGCRALAEVTNYSTLVLEKGSPNYGYVAYYATTVTNGMPVVAVGAIFAPTPGVKKSNILKLIEKASNGKQSGFQTFEITVPVSGWSSSGTYDVAFGALTKKDLILMDAPTVADSIIVGNSGIYSDTYSVSTDGSGVVRLSCAVKPESEVTVVLVRFPYCAPCADDSDESLKTRADAVSTKLNGTF